MANSLRLRQLLKFSFVLQNGTIIPNNHKSNLLRHIPVIFNPIRLSSFRSSYLIKDVEKYPKIEIIKNPPEWKYVENLMPSLLVPYPIQKAEYPSGWQPQIDIKKIKGLPYFINRNKNHMLPVYLRRTFRGLRRITFVRRIQGDLWKLEDEIKTEIEKNIGKKIATRINEMSGQIQFKGDFVEFIKEFLIKKGF